MDKTHYERRSHEQGNYEIIPTYKGQVVVTIKSLATGKTMKVYLDEPTQSVEDGINHTNYTGHFYEEEFMVTPSEGFEITGLPLMYPYWSEPSLDTITTVIDTENHYYSEKHTDYTNSMNFASFPIVASFADFPNSETLPDSGNAVLYTFTRFGWEGPGIIINPGSGSELNPNPLPIDEGGIH